MKLAPPLRVLAASFCMLGIIVPDVAVNAVYLNANGGIWVNNDVECPDGYAIVGACSSGKNRDCWEVPSTGNKVSHVIRCEKLDGSWFSSVSTCAPHSQSLQRKTAMANATIDAVSC